MVASHGHCSTSRPDYYSALAPTLKLGFRAGYNRRWGVTDEAYFLVFGSLHAGLGRLALMPLVVLASRICPKVSANGQLHSPSLEAATGQCRRLTVSIVVRWRRQHSQKVAMPSCQMFSRQA